MALRSPLWYALFTTLQGQRVWLQFSCGGLIGCMILHWHAVNKFLRWKGLSFPPTSWSAWFSLDYPSKIPNCVTVSMRFGGNGADRPDSSGLYGGGGGYHMFWEYLWRKEVSRVADILCMCRLTYFFKHASQILGNFDLIMTVIHNHEQRSGNWEFWCLILGDWLAISIDNYELI